MAASSVDRLSATPSFRLGHLPALDGIRGIAIISVMLFHLYLPLRGDYTLFGGGFLGVDIFFVLSGFLITTILVSEWQKTGNIGLREFYRRRILRLVPALVTTVAVVIVVTALGALVNDAAREQLRVLRNAVPAAALYIANWVEAYRWFDLGPIQLTWSLAIEEQFYLVWPLLLLALLRRGVPHGWLIVLVGIGVACSVAWRALLFHDGATRPRLYFGSDTRADAILIGCALGLIATGGWLPRIDRLRPLLTVATAVGAAVTAVAILLVPQPWGAGAYLFYGGFTAVAAATALLIAYVLITPDGVIPSVLSFKPLAWTGRLSYGLYLWHGVIFWTMRIFVAPRIFGADGVDRYGFNAASRLVAIIIAIAAASASYYLVERRFLRLKDRSRAETPKNINYASGQVLVQ